MLYWVTQSILAKEGKVAPSCTNSFVCLSGGDTRFCIKLLLIVSFRFLYIIQPACVNEINTSCEEELVNHQKGNGSQCNKILLGIVLTFKKGANSMQMIIMKIICFHCWFSSVSHSVYHTFRRATTGIRVSCLQGVSLLIKRSFLYVETYFESVLIHNTVVSS